jgi:hypothetical protein
MKKVNMVKRKKKRGLRTLSQITYFLQDSTRGQENYELTNESELDELTKFVFIKNC